MRRFNGVLQIVGEMVSIVALALTGRFISFAQTTLESGVPLTMARALSHFTDIASIFWRLSYAGLLLSVLVGASLIRIGIAYVNRSVLLSLRQRAGIGEDDLTWGQRTVRLPFAAVYRTLNGVATFVGAIALAICFRLGDWGSRVQILPLRPIKSGTYGEAVGTASQCGDADVTFQAGHARPRTLAAADSASGAVAPHWRPFPQTIRE